MRRFLLVIMLGASACQEAPPYVLAEADVRVLVEHRCRASADCCGQQEDVDACADALATEILNYDELTEATLTYSEACMKAVLVWAPEIDCSPATELEAPGCRLAHGDRSRGEPCISFGDLGFFGTDCDDGLQCLAGRCVDDPFFVTQRAQEGEVCDPYTLCEPELFCDGTGTCRRRVEPGGSCVENGECGPTSDYYCRGFMAGVGQCVAKSGLGEPCDPLELACAFECDSDGDCQLLECVEGTCSPRGPAVCELL